MKNSSSELHASKLGPISKTARPNLQTLLIILNFHTLLWVNMTFKSDDISIVWTGSWFLFLHDKVAGCSLQQQQVEFMKKIVEECSVMHWVLVVLAFEHYNFGTVWQGDISNLLVLWQFNSLLKCQKKIYWQKSRLIVCQRIFCESVRIWPQLVLQDSGCKTANNFLFTVADNSLQVVDNGGTLEDTW